jgi:site-specific recombinase XerD
MRQELADFLDCCRIERRLARLTCSAYERDADTCIAFLEREGLVTVGEVRPLQAARRSESAITAYRIAIDDLLAWCGDRDRSIFDEVTIVDYLADYQRRTNPAPATYYRRFGLLRRFVRWLSRRSGTPDPFLDLEAPPKPRQEADWLTEQELGRLLAAAEHPPRRRTGLAERDRLVLLTLVQTGLRRAELIALDWADLELERPRPSLLVRCGKGGAAPAATRASACTRIRAPSRGAGRGRKRTRLLRPGGQAPATDDPRRDHPPRSRASRNREARHRAHAPAYRGDVATAADGRRPTRGRLSRPLRPVHGQQVRARRGRRAARCGRGSGGPRDDAGGSLRRAAARASNMGHAGQI